MSVVGVGDPYEHSAASEDPIRGVWSLDRWLQGGGTGRGGGHGVAGMVGHDGCSDILAVFGQDSSCGMMKTIKSALQICEGGSFEQGISTC